MDLLVFGLLNIAFLIGGFIVIARRIERQFGTKTFLDRVEVEANAMITELNATTERNIRILEATIANLQATIATAETTAKKLAQTTVAKAQPPVQEVTTVGQLEPKSVYRQPTPISSSAIPLESETSPQGRILRLHDQGFDAEAIAQRVGRTVGEVDLIIKLAGASR
jgi:hypothetical protein